MMRVVVTALACAAGAFALTSGLQQRAPLASRPRAIAQQRCQRAAVRGRAAAAPAGAVTMMAGALDEGSVTGTGFAAAVYKFCRPHTIRGTMLASFAGVCKALSDCGGLAAAWNWALLPRALQGVVVLLAGNAFIVGINQIYDVEVDKVNKPFLPIASGEMSPLTAKLLLAACAVVGPALCYHAFSPLIFRLYMFGTTVGTLYSVPPFELKKRGPLWAGLAIATCRGFLLNFGVYYATLEALGVPFRWNPGVAFMARFMTVFAGVIAVTKDLPDVEGDKQYDVQTFATRVGVSAVARGATLALLLNYVSAIAQAALSPAGAFARRPMIAGHAALGALLARNYKRFEREGGGDAPSAVASFYKSIWDLFYLEYLLYIFI